MENVQPGEYITITDRKCGEKMQPNVKCGDTFIVKKIERTTKGVPVLVCRDKDDPKRVVRCNAQRFRWCSVDFWNEGNVKPYSGKLKEGHMIIITARYIPSNIQREIGVNKIFKVRQVKKFRDGHTELMVSFCRPNGYVYKISSERFHWERLVVGQLMSLVQDKNEKKAAIDKMYNIAYERAFDASKDKLLQDFTFSEQAKISYIPLIVYYIAWQYADKAVQYAAEHRIEEVKKLSRSVKMLREKYLDYLRRYLDREHIMQVRQQAESFISDHQLLFTQLYFTVLNAINHQHIGISYDSLSAYAFITKMLVSFLFEFENEMTALIRARLGSANDAHMPHQDALMACMDAYLGDYNITTTKDIEVGLQIFVNEVYNIEYKLKK